MASNDPKKKFHPTLRRQVIAIADADIKQVQVVDKDGEIRPIIVWICGPDMYWADNMDGLFDNARRKKAPDWLKEQIAALPADRRFRSDGSVATESPGVAVVAQKADTDLPDFRQA